MVLFVELNNSALEKQPVKSVTLWAPLKQHGSQLALTLETNYPSQYFALLFIQKYCRFLNITSMFEYKDYNC